MYKVKLQSEYEDLDKYKYDNGDIIYLKKNPYIWHNQYGPAFVTKTGYKEYCINGKYHRLDGPAKIWYDGHTEYWINGKLLTKEEFETHPERLKFLGKEHLICLR